MVTDHRYVHKRVNQ